jgi:hypothetical protein
MTSLIEMQMIGYLFLTFILGSILLGIIVQSKKPGKTSNITYKVYYKRGNTKYFKGRIEQ